MNTKESVGRTDQAASPPLKWLAAIIDVLNHRRTRGLMSFGVLCVFIALLFLKPLQTFLASPVPVRLPEAVSKGLENRLDDPSLWTIFGAALACFVIYRVSTEPGCRTTGLSQSGVCTVKLGVKALVAWLLLSAFGCFVYLDAVKHAHETFWIPVTGQPGQKAMVVIQWTEGVLNIYAIAASYLFEVIAFCVVYSTRSRTARQPLDCRLRCYSPTYIFYAIVSPALVMLLLFALEKIGLGTFLKTYFDWKFLPYTGKSAAEVVGLFVLFWLPNLFLLLYAFVMWHRDIHAETTDALKVTLPTFTFKFCDCPCLTSPQSSAAAGGPSSST